MNDLEVKSAMENPIQQVFLITDGPRCVTTVQIDDGIEYEADTAKLQHRLEACCRETGKPVLFQVMPGLLCLDVRDADGCLEVEPLLLISSPMVVVLEEITHELGNFNGVKMYARIRKIEQFDLCLPSDRYNIPTLETGDLICISYDLARNTGGFCKIKNRQQDQDVLPLVDSRSELRQGYTRKETRRGRMTYKIARIGTEQ